MFEEERKETKTISTVVDGGTLGTDFLKSAIKVSIRFATFCMFHSQLQAKEHYEVEAVTASIAASWAKHRISVLKRRGYPESNH